MGCRLAKAVEDTSWDGAWYRRAYFDDGTPLGTRDAEECRIDAIAQAWATISGLGDPERAETALESVEEKLVRREDWLIALLTPPFDQMAHDPGYIKGYVPGVRENGGQYTHAAVWVVLAYLLQRRRRRGRRAARPHQPDQPCARPPRRLHATRSSPTWWPPTSTRSRRTWAAAAGPGTPARRPGSTASRCAGCSGSALELPRTAGCT